jgi:hypothetical protein
LFGCTVRNEPSINTQAVITPSPLATQTIISIITSTAGLEPTTIPAVPIATKTEKPFPTISPTEIESQFYELLQPNPNCQLPCWWGIVPGKSNTEDTQQFSEFSQQNTKNFSWSSTVTFVQEAGIISQIFVSADGFYNPDTFWAEWKIYSPEELTNEYGQPTRIWLNNYADQITPPYASPRNYGLWLFYDTLGILVIYEGRVEIKPDYLLCPTISTSGNLLPTIKIFLQSPKYPKPLESRVGENGGIHTSAETLETAIGVTNQEFYERLQKNKEGVICFETSKEIWPP